MSKGLVRESLLRMISGFGHVSDYPGGKCSCLAPRRAGGRPRHPFRAGAEFRATASQQASRDNYALAAGYEHCLAPAHPVGLMPSKLQRIIIRRENPMA